MSVAVLVLVAVGAVVVVLIVAVAIVVLRGRPRFERAAVPGETPPGFAPPSVPSATLPDAPMSGLESALSQVTDRSGRPLREHLDAEARHVDELRVVDDTGPLLRRVLDHVAGSDRTGVSNGDAPAAEPDDDAT